MADEAATLEGRCTCGKVRYRLAGRPFAVHCCHCRDCQRETGSAFVINGLIETPMLGVVAGTPETIDTPSAIYDASFTVGITDNNDALNSAFSFGSSRGPVTIDGSGRRKPDVAAPGTDIRSSKRGGGYGMLTGTSQAGPAPPASPPWTPATCSSLCSPAASCASSGRRGAARRGRA